MCMKTECPTCHKPTWRGCGMHIESALSGEEADMQSILTVVKRLMFLCCWIVAGVKVDDRCPEWKTGKHYLPGQEPQGWCSVQ
ncbi:hypothetical protein DVH05_018511 [Phytophthora capsici]|nr:hypothetical protein DVH05_018511 [Phytophthora capsici]